MPMIMRAKYTKVGMMKYLSHLDLVRLFERAFRRAEIPLAFTQGFNPHPMVSFASPLSIGVSSEAEYFDLVLSTPLDAKEFTQRMNDTLPEGIHINAARLYSTNKLTSLMKESALLSYRIEGHSNIPLQLEALDESISSFLAQPEILIEKTIKKNKYKHRKQNKSVTVNIRSLIHSFNIKSVKENFFTAELEIYNYDSGTVKPLIVCQNWIRFSELQICQEDLTFHRTEVCRKNSQESFEAILSSDSYS
ncbi:MAG: DUF2344 domain-containing protein [Tindallia sp. MSAO_Bac2]|nr:MAG: DUF2344 domain-containing protein [Tindallia sp. MSAO_Bac2]